jgi:hypothetical protein
MWIQKPVCVSCAVLLVLLHSIAATSQLICENAVSDANTKQILMLGCLSDMLFLMYMCSTRFHFETWLGSWHYRFNVLALWLHFSLFFWAAVVSPNIDFSLYTWNVTLIVWSSWFSPLFAFCIMALLFITTPDM